MCGNNMEYPEINNDEIKKFIEEEVPDYQRGLIINTLDKDEISIDDMELIGKQLVGEEMIDDEPIMRGILKEKKAAGKVPKKGIWHYIKLEIFKFFCTDDSQYEEERSKGSGNVKMAVSAIAGFLGSTLGVGAGIITGGVTFALISVLKISKTGVCEFFRHNFHIEEEVVNTDYDNIEYEETKD